MKKYIFNVKSIPITIEAYGRGYKFQIIVNARTLEEAMDEVEEKYKPNIQFRFKYQFQTMIEE